MSESKLSTTQLDLLEGTTVRYWLSSPFEPTKPTIVLINSFGTNTKLFESQFADKELMAVTNLLAIEPLGHGVTRCKRVHWTYWDSANMFMELLAKLKIERAFALGTSQGGFIAARMALIAPEKILGIILLGTSLDTESLRLTERGCWDGKAVGDRMLARWETHANDGDKFMVPAEWSCSIAASGFGDQVSQAIKDLWTKEIQQTYLGEGGRQQLIMMAMNLKDRDGLHARLSTVKAPVLWMQGTLDPVFSVKTAEHELSLFTGSPSTRLVSVPDGHHFLSASNPRVVNEEVIAFVKQHENTITANL